MCIFPKIAVGIVIHDCIKFSSLIFHENLINILYSLLIIYCFIQRIKQSWIRWMYNYVHPHYELENLALSMAPNYLVICIISILTNQLTQYRVANSTDIVHTVY